MAETCRSCDAEVIFVPSAKTGKPMILDAKPEKRVVLVRAKDQRILYWATPGDQDGPAAQVVSTYVDHHATCPAAAGWIGRNRAGRS